MCNQVGAKIAMPCFFWPLLDTTATFFAIQVLLACKPLLNNARRHAAGNTTTDTARLVFGLADADATDFIACTPGCLVYKAQL